MTRALQQDGLVPGWRDEMYPVTSAFTAQPLLLIERAAAVPFGIKAGQLAMILLPFSHLQV